MALVPNPLTRLLADIGLFFSHLKGRNRALMAFALGSLSVLALPPLHILPVLFVTLPGFVWLLDGVERPTKATWKPAMRAAALTGWAFGFGYFLFGLYWIGFAFLVEAEKFLWALPFAVTLLPAGLAFFFAAAAAAAKWFWRPGARRLLAFAIALALTEWLRGHILTGFPWNLIGESFSASPNLMQLGSVLGAYGVSLIAILIFISPAACDARQGKQSAFRLASLLVPLGGLAALALIWAGGEARLAAAGTQQPTGTHIRIVQPNIPQTMKWNVENRMAIIGKFIRMSMEPSEAMPGGLTPHSVVVWPESALAVLLAREPYIMSAVARILPEGALLITGSVRGEPAEGGKEGDRLERYYNSLYAINARGEIVGIYDKFHLVPFGEYLPLRHLLSKIGLRQLAKLQGSFDTGPGPVTLSLPGVPDVSPLICYEIIFPGKVVAGGGATRPAWIVNVTNDAWFGTSPGPYQHLSQARMRAVEQGLPVIRSANTGVSAVIDPYGRVMQSQALNTQGVIDTSLPAPLAPTFYARIGDISFGFLLLLGGLLLFWRRPDDV